MDLVTGRRGEGTDDLRVGQPAQPVDQRPVKGRPQALPSGMAMVSYPGAGPDTGGK